jgi:hypothetical protein
LLHNDIYEEPAPELLDVDSASLSTLFEPFQDDIEAHSQQAEAIIAAYIRAHPDAFCDD